MPRLTQAVPKYSKHKASGQAIVSIQGRDFYLGPHGTKASKLEYDRIVNVWLANGRQLPQAGADLVILEVVADFRTHALKYYRKNGRTTRSLGNIDDAVKPLLLLYGRELVQEFGPLKLQAIQTVLANGYVNAKGKQVAGVSRGVVNKRVGIIKQIFRWAVSQEMAPPSLAHALDAVRGLQRGRTDARETEPVKPVDGATIDATLVHLPALLADMVRFQRLTGCRPGEVCNLRPRDIDRSGEVWTYRPASHKTEHHGRQRTIFVGPKAQEILKPYLLRDSAAYCFQPADSERKRLEARHAERTTPLSCGNRPGTNRVRRRKRHPGRQYDKNTYRTAIARACDKAGVPRWRPNQLRHTAATEIRHRFGLEAAQVILGHSRADVTQVYAERDASLGQQVVKAIG
jgi:integrase